MPDTLTVLRDCTKPEVKNQDKTNQRKRNGSTPETRPKGAIMPFMATFRTLRTAVQPYAQRGKGCSALQENVFRTAKDAFPSSRKARLAMRKSPFGKATETVYQWNII